MKSGKYIALAVALIMLFTLIPAFAPLKVEAAVDKLDWAPYDELIKGIKSEKDFVKREALMHQAEDMLMDSGAVCPLYYYNDPYMAKADLQGYYSNLFGFKFFMFSDYGDKDTLRINIASEPDRLDPALNSSVDGACLAVNSFAGLWTYNAEGKLQNDLAEKVDVSDDGLTYTFTLRDGLKWSDGSPLTAADFEYSWKRGVNWMTAADYAYMFDVIDGYPEMPEQPEAKEGEEAKPTFTEEEANAAADKLNVKASEDGKTLTVVLKSPCAYFLDLCAFPCYFPVQKAAVEGAKGFRDKDGKIVEPGAWALEAGFPSNGAYVLKEWKHKESMVYEKNPNYYRADEVKINRLEFMLSDDASVIFSAYKAGNLDFIDAVPVDEVPNLKDKDPEFHIVPNLGTYFVIFNVNSPLFDGKTADQGKAMRKAISLLIDRQYIVDTVAQTGQECANTFIPTGMADGHGGVFRENDDDFKYPLEDEKGYFSLEPDSDKAVELLKSAGFEFDDKGMLSENTPLHIRYLTNKSDAHQKIAELIQQDLATIGITMEVEQMDWATTLNERKAGNYDVARHGWVADFNDPINMLEMWTTDSGNNDAQFGR